MYDVTMTPHLLSLPKLRFLVKHWPMFCVLMSKFHSFYYKSIIYTLRFKTIIGIFFLKQQFQTLLGSNDPPPHSLILTSYPTPVFGFCFVCFGCFCDRKGYKRDYYYTLGHFLSVLERPGKKQKTKQKTKQNKTNEKKKSLGRGIARTTVSLRSIIYFIYYFFAHVQSIFFFFAHVTTWIFKTDKACMYMYKVCVNQIIQIGESAQSNDFYLLSTVYFLQMDYQKSTNNAKIHCISKKSLKCEIGTRKYPKLEY